MTFFLWHQEVYYRDEVNVDANENDAACIKINKKNNKKKKPGKTSKYNTKLIGSTLNNNNILDREVVFPLKYLSNFGRSLDLLLIDC